MAAMTLYSFEDADGNEPGTFTTTNYDEAKEYAARYKYKVIANEYVWDDSELVDDFTEQPASAEVEFNCTKCNDTGIAIGGDRAACDCSLGQGLVAFCQQLDPFL
jgi:hypothetical protein